MTLHGSSRRRPLQYEIQAQPTEKAKNITPSRQRAHLIHARLALSAGVQTMRARICSAISCAMFARVVWLRLRGVRNYRFLLCPLPHALATHYFLRLTRARGRRFLRGRKALLNDFWYFWSRKSTRKEKFL